MMKTMLRFIISLFIVAIALAGAINPIAAAAENSVSNESFGSLASSLDFSVSYTAVVAPHSVGRDILDVELYETSVDAALTYHPDNQDLWALHQVIYWTYTDTGLIYSVDSYYSYGEIIATGWSCNWVTDLSAQYGSTWFRLESEGKFSGGGESFYPLMWTKVWGDGSVTGGGSI
jgi:hypothetical protein